MHKCIHHIHLYVIQLLSTSLPSRLHLRKASFRKLASNNILHHQTPFGVKTFTTLCDDNPDDLSIQSHYIYAVVCVYVFVPYGLTALCDDDLASAIGASSFLWFN